MTTSGDRPDYLDDLPAIYRQAAEADDGEFFGNLLHTCEKVLTGSGDPGAPGLEEIVEGIGDGDTVALAGAHRYFDPGPDVDEPLRAPESFLEWLSGWVALSLRADLRQEQQRELIARAVELYRCRGTRYGLEQLLRIYTGLSATIEEGLGPGLQVGVRSTVGVDTSLAGEAPHFFRVTIRLRQTDPQELRRQRQVAEAVIEQEKPAHTYYLLDVETPTMQIGVHSTIGVDTLLGSTPE